MPLYLNVGLPGPFRYVRQVGGRDKPGPLYWLFIGFWWVPVKWALIIVIVLMIYTASLLVQATRAAVEYARHTWRNRDH